MGYEINNNTYTTTKRLQAYNVFTKKINNIDKGTEIDSVWASFIIVKNDEREAFKSLTPQQGIDKRVELGYITLKV